MILDLAAVSLHSNDVDEETQKLLNTIRGEFTACFIQSFTDCNARLGQFYDKDLVQLGFHQAVEVVLMSAKAMAADMAKREQDDA